MPIMPVALTMSVALTMPVALVLLPVLVFSWVLLAAFLLMPPKKNRIINKISLARYFGYDRVSTLAKEAGWNISSKEFWGIVIFAVLTGLLLAAVFMNPLIIVSGIVAGYYFPRILIQKYRKRRRMAMISSIPEFGRILAARLIDCHSIVRAMETTQNDISGPVKTISEEFVKDIGVGLGVQPALENMKSKAGFRKFNTLAETLLIAHREGYSSEALRAIEKAVEAIENDVKAIELLHIATRKKKQELLCVVLASWAFPVILSFMNTDNVNIYLDTPAGKILMFSYIISTLLVLTKGEEYLSLRLEEL